MDTLLLPATLDELTESVAGPFLSKEDFTNRAENIITVAEEFGAVRKCILCDKPMVNAFEFVDRTIEHYGVEEGDYPDKIVHALHRSVVETGGLHDEVLCSDCDGRFQRDTS